MPAEMAQTGADEGAPTGATTMRVTSDGRGPPTGNLQRAATRATSRGASEVGLRWRGNLRRATTHARDLRRRWRGAARAASALRRRQRRWQHATSDGLHGISDARAQASYFAWTSSPNKMVSLRFFIFSSFFSFNALPHQL
jgi:hypothetical protein